MTQNRMASQGAATSRAHLRVFDRPRSAPPPSPGIRWFINGFPATVLIWTQEQWATLADPPSDAQPHPDGFWCALRME